jgi:high-affinity iron transporter
MRRLALLAPLAAVLALAAGAATAHAATEDDQFAGVRAKVAQASVLIDQAVAAAAAGNREEAYDIARTAYLDHFELAEVPLRLRNPNLVLDLEFAFAKLRNGIRDGDPMSEVRANAIAVQQGLRDVDRSLADKGLAAPLIAFVFSFTILFREGLEAVLLIAILLGSLKAGRATNYRRPLVAGIGAAIVATFVTWLLAAFVIEIAPLQRELLEGVTALVAVVILFAITFWLVARLEHRHWMEFMRARVSSAIAAGTGFAFAALGFTAVYREGFETALFYQALALFAEGLTLWILLGVVAAALSLAVVAFAILKLGKRLPLKPMLMTAAMLLLLLSVAFVGNAVRSLQEGDWIGVTPIDGSWARPPIYVAELTGIHPTKEGLLTQGVLLAVYLAGALYMFVVRPALRRRGGEVARA